MRQAPAERRLRQSDRDRSSEHEVNYTAALLPWPFRSKITSISQMHCMHLNVTQGNRFGMVQVHGESWWTMVNPHATSAKQWLVSPLEAPTPLWGSRPQEEASWRRRAGDPTPSHDLFGVDVYHCLPHIYGSGDGLLLGLPHYISWFFAKPVNMHEVLTI